MKFTFLMLCALFVVGCGPVETAAEKYEELCEHTPDFIGVRYYEPEGFMCCYDRSVAPFTVVHCIHHP